MKTDYSQLLEKTIYLEGLIRIAVSRVEPEQELLAMLARESAALAEALACPKAEAIQVPQAVPAPEVTVVETVVAPSAPAPIVETAPIVAPAEPAPAPAVTVAAPAVVAPAPEPEPAPKAIPAEVEIAPAATELEAEPFRLEDKVASKAAGSISHLFTLNDKFRFRRELFNNSQQELDDTLAVLDDMASLDEAREYLTDDLCLDPSDPAVKDFFGIVAKHFA
ncbi:MAG: hypothetical protein K2G35_03090 [Duncaniella sp.]|nr:hypothetical protein [Duncaniella sp.]